MRLCLVKNSYVYRAGMRLLKYFEKRCKELGLNFDEELFQESEAKRLRLDDDNVEENSASDSDDEVQKKR